jgi:hypothetical protein
MRLRGAINKFCIEYSPAKPFTLSELEWKQIGYLIDLVRPFQFFTTTVGKTKSVTLPYALAIYDELFERLNESRRRLKAKASRLEWIGVLIQGIDAAEAKLDVYYNKTYSNLGSLYGIGAILNPRTKSDCFDKEYCWLDSYAKDWKLEFEDQFRALYHRDYADRGSRLDYLRGLREENMDPLALMLDRSRVSRDMAGQSSSQRAFNDKVDEWFAMSKLSIYTNYYTNLYNH